MKKFKITRLLFAMVATSVIWAADDRPAVIPFPSQPATPVGAEDMTRIYEQVKTPFKYGVVLVGAGNRSENAP